ncbi:MAG: hypothetical protein B7Z73_19760, partial [Planctomycetia bacterium 21-64-5]
IAVDGSGDAYVTGYTGSTNFPTSNPLQATNGGVYDAFVAKISAALIYSASAGGNYTIKKVGGTIEVLDSNSNIVAQSTDTSSAATFTNNSTSPITLTVDYSGGDPIPSGGLTFTGGGSDTLKVSGYGAGTDLSETFTGSGSGAVQVGSGAATTYTGLSPVLMDGGTPGNVVFTLPADAHALLKDNGSGTPEIVSTDATPAFEATTFTAPSGSLTIYGAGGDSITTDPTFTADFNTSLAIDGTATDTVTLNALDLTAPGASLSVTGQTINIGGDITTSSTQDYNGPTAIDTSVSLTGSTITFGDKVDDATVGADALTVSGAGVFKGVVGGTKAL